MEKCVNAASKFRALPVDDLLERISELEATYHLNIRLWRYPQLRKPRYWDRHKICEFRPRRQVVRLTPGVVIDHMGQAEEALSCHMREAEAAFRALSGRSPPKPRSLFNEGSLRLPPPYPKPRAKPATIASDGGASSSGSSSQTADPTALPRASATKFLTNYYLSLSEIRDSLKRWRAELKAIANNV